MDNGRGVIDSVGGDAKKLGAVAASFDGGGAGEVAGVLQWASEYPAVAVEFFRACAVMAEQGTNFGSVAGGVSGSRVGGSGVAWTYGLLGASEGRSGCTAGVGACVARAGRLPTSFVDTRPVAGSSRGECGLGTESVAADGCQCVGSQPGRVGVGSRDANPGGADLCEGGDLRVGCVALGSVRGPNFARNHANRLRRREQALQKKAEFLQSYEKASRVGQSRGFGRPERTATEQELHELKVERQIIQEKRKLEKLKSPAQMIEDAMRQVAIAERCAKLANDSKVAKWAADLSSASAESIARSAGADVRTLGSGSSAARSAGVGAGSSVTRPVGVSTRVSGVGGLETDGVHHPSRVVGAGFSVDEFDESELCKTFSATLTSATSMSTDLNAVTRADALKWLKRYEYLDKYYFAGKGLTAMCKASGTSVSEVNKYLVFRKRFF